MQRTCHIFTHMQSGHLAECLDGPTLMLNTGKKILGRGQDSKKLMLSTSDKNEKSF